ncbi:MAG: pyruvate ferredoxin oxidoreductase [Deltaproteobacteria bacterium]|nr:pyruvate ferredoxin oxidoreductase [Deltaproteobacteria bacterium]
MSKAIIMTGNSAAALAAKMCRIQVVAAYPITPQTSITEAISNYVESGELKAEYVRVESEHSALTVCIAASTVGARAFTSTSSHGLLYMHEQVHWAAGSRLPIVMCCVNRGVGAPWSIFNDQQDSVSQRDTGWIQLYCRDNQEIIDTVIQAYKIAEAVSVPVMVCYDGFVLSHTMMPVVVPMQEQVDAFLPPLKTSGHLDTANPRNINPVVFPWRRADSQGVMRDGYMEIRYKLHSALNDARGVITQVNGEYARVFGRDHGGLLWDYNANAAEILIVAMGSIASESMPAIDSLRAQGINVGLIGVRAFRPFPKLEVREKLAGAKAIIVLEKAISYGHDGALACELKAALYGSAVRVPFHSYVAGLGGRDVNAKEIEAAITDSLKQIAEGNLEPPTHWLNCRTE